MIDDYFRISGKKIIKMTKSDEIIKFKIYTRKSNLFCTYFKSILVPENNEIQNPNESYTNKHQNHVGCSFV